MQRWRKTVWTTLPLSPHTVSELTGLVLLLGFSDASELGSALRPHFSQLIMELWSLCFQLLSYTRREKDKGCLAVKNCGTSWGGSSRVYEILAELSVCGASFPFYRDSFVLLTSYAEFRWPPVLPWQWFLLKYRWECKLIFKKLKWRRGWIKLLKTFEAT